MWSLPLCLCICQMLIAPIEILRIISASDELILPSPFVSAFIKDIWLLISEVLPVEYLSTVSASAELTFPSPFTSAVAFAASELEDTIL